MTKIGIINTNREPYPMQPGTTNGGLIVTGLIADNLPSNFEPFFFTAQDTITKAHKISFEMDSYFKFSDKKVLQSGYSKLDNKIILHREQTLFAKAIDFCHQNNIQLLHVHNNIFNIAHLLPQLKIPVVFTSHDPVTSYHNYLVKDAKNFHFVAISKNQFEAAKTLLSINPTLIYNGIQTDIFEFNDKEENFMLFVGRLVDYKGIIEAMKAAIILKIPLKIIGQFNQNLENPQTITWIKENFSRYPELFFHIPQCSKEKIIAEYQKAKLVLYPSINREEPCPLVPLEAMSCGAPVVAFSQGALPELIADGKTGYVVNPSQEINRGSWIIKETGVEGLIDAIKKIFDMDSDKYKATRTNSRQWIENNFSISKMVNQYQELYLKILNKI